MNRHRFTYGQQLAALVVSWRTRTTFDYALEKYARPYRHNVSTYWETAAETLLSGRLPEPDAEVGRASACACPGCPASNERED